MALYNYRTILYVDTANVIGLDTTQNALDVANYVNNYRADTDKLDEILMAETAFLIDLSYTDFKTKVVDPIAWTDVKEIHRQGRYELNLISGTSL
jgi:hypothetical protein